MLRDGVDFQLAVPVQPLAAALVRPYYTLTNALSVRVDDAPARPVQLAVHSKTDVRFTVTAAARG